MGRRQGDAIPHFSPGKGCIIKLMFPILWFSFSAKRLPTPILSCVPTYIVRTAPLLANSINLELGLGKISFFTFKHC